MKKQSLNALAASYRADLLYYIERAKLGKCPPHWQAYCFGEIAAAKGTDAYPEDGDALLDELHRLVDTVPQITNREESVAEIAAYRGRCSFTLTATTTRWPSWCACRTGKVRCLRLH